MPRLFRRRGKDEKKPQKKAKKKLKEETGGTCSLSTQREKREFVWPDPWKQRIGTNGADEWSGFQAREERKNWEGGGGGGASQNP